QFRMIDDALGDTVRLAESEWLAFGKQFGFALDALRLGNQMFGTPVIGSLSRLAQELRLGWQLPSRVMTEVKDAREHAEHHKIGNGAQDDAPPRTTPCSFGK